MKRITFLGIVLMLCLACIGTVAAGSTDINLVSNGGFESPTANNPWSTYYDNPGNEITGWIIESGSINIKRDYWTPHSGSQSIDLAGDAPGKISQTINTEIGGNYKIEFWMAGNPNTQGNKELIVYWDGYKVSPTTGSLTFDTTGKSRTDMGWTFVSITGLKATKTSTKVVFEQGATGNPCRGVALDDITIVDPPTPAPEFPSTTLPAAMLVGFMGIILFIQKSRKD